MSHREFHSNASASYFPYGDATTAGKKMHPWIITHLWLHYIFDEETFSKKNNAEILMIAFRIRYQFNGMLERRNGFSSSFRVSNQLKQRKCIRTHSTHKL